MQLALNTNSLFILFGGNNELQLITDHMAWSGHALPWENKQRRIPATHRIL